MGGREHQGQLVGNPPLSSLGRGWEAQVGKPARVGQMEAVTNSGRMGRGIGFK